MPSIRTLARTLGVSRGTVAAAYDQLVAEGYLISAPRSGMRVNPELPLVVPTRHDDSRAVKPPRPEPDAVVVDLVPGHDRSSPPDDPAWRAAWRRAADPGRGQQRPDPLGAAQLRSAIAEHLRLMRGILVDPDNVVVTAGSREGLALLLTALPVSRGSELQVGVEDPGFPGLRRTLARRGVTTVPLPVDDSGLVVPRAPGTPAPDLVLVTPNHQFPYGSVMPARRRTELLHWAAETATLVVEDDYDSEHRYLGPPPPALHGLVPSAPVVHLGTFSGVLSTDVGTGYLLLPTDLVARVGAVRADLGCPVAPVLQRAIAGYLADGGLRRRLQRSRRRLVAAHEVVTRAIPQLPGAVDLGRLLVLELPEDEAHTVLAECARRGVLLGDLADGWSRWPRSRGVVLNYDAVDPATLARALEVLAGSLVRMAGGPVSAGELGGG